MASAPRKPTDSWPSWTDQVRYGLSCPSGPPRTPKTDTSPADLLDALAATYAAQNDPCSKFVAGLLHEAARDARFVHAKTFEDIADRMEVMERDREERLIALGFGQGVKDAGEAGR